METYRLALQPVSLAQEEVLAALHLEEGEPEDIERAMEMAHGLCEAACPKALYGVAPVTGQGEDWVELDGRVRFASKLVRENLEGIHKIIPYVCTCGLEAQAWSEQFQDPLEEFWAEELKIKVLGRISGLLHRKIKDTYFPSGKMASMNPGSLKQWPLTAQGELFSLLGTVTEQLGVTLTDSFLMLPHKSNSGFFFANDTGYENCQLCPLLDCPNRRAKFQG